MGDLGDLISPSSRTAGTFTSGRTPAQDPAPTASPTPATNTASSGRVDNCSFLISASIFDVDLSA
jgi:hypothetical protein